MDYVIQKKSGKFLSRNTWGNFSLNYIEDKALTFFTKQEAYFTLREAVKEKPKFGKYFWIVKRERVKNCVLKEKELFVF
jgi:hypothetical protein